MKPRYLVHALAGVVVLAFLGLTSFIRAADSEVAGIRAQAENGNAIAQYNLGLMYADGRAVVRDPIEAYVWLSLARENGATGRALGVLTGTMAADQLTAAKSRLDERRRTIPGVVGTHSTAAARSVAATPPAAAPASPPSSAPAGPEAAVTGPVPLPAELAPAPEARTAALETEVVTLRADKSKLSEELATAWKESDQAKAAATAADQRARQAEATLSQRARDIIILQTEREQLRGQLAAAPAASAVEDLRQERDRLASRLSIANADLQSLHDRLTRLEEDHDKLQTAGRAGAAQDAKLAALSSELANTRQALATAETARAAVAKIQDQVDTLTRQLTAARQELASAQSNGTELAAQVKKLSDDKKALSQQLAAGSDAARELASLRTRAGQNENELNILRARNADLVAANQKIEEQVLSAAQGGGDKSAAALAEARTQLQALESELAKQGRQVVAVEIERDQLRQQVAGLTQQRDGAVGQLAASRANVSDSAQITAKLADADKARQAAETKTAGLEETVAGLRRQNAELTSARDQLETQVKKLTGDKAALDQQLAAGGAAVAELASLRARVAQHETDLKTLQTRNTELAAASQKLEEQSRTVAQQTGDKSTAALAEAQKQQKNLEAELAKQGRQVVALEQERDQFRAQLTAAQADVTRNIAAGEAQAKDVARLTSQVASLQQELGRAQTESGSLAVQVKKLTGDKAALDQQLAAADAAKGELTKNAAQISDEAGRSKTALADAERRAQQAEAALGQRTKDVAALQADLENARRSVAELTAAHGSAAQAAKVAEQDRRERDEFRRQLDASRQDLAAARAAHEGLAAQVKQLTDEKAALAQGAGQRQALETKAGEQEKQITALTGERDQLRQQVATAAKAAQAETERLNGQVAELTKQLAAAQTGQADVAKLTAQVADANRRADQVEKDAVARSGRLGDTQAKLEQVQALLDAAQKAAVARESQAQDLARLNAEVTSLTQQLEVARTDLAAAQKAGTGRVAETARQLDEARATITNLQKENTDLKSEHASLAARLAQAAAASAAPAVVAAATSSTDDVARLKDELSRSEAKVEMTVRSYALTQQENERLKAQIGQAQDSTQRATEAEAALAKAQQELTALHETADRSASEAESLRTQLTGATQSGASSSAEVTRLNGDLVAARDAATKANAEAASLRELVRQTQNAGASLATENARLKTALAFAGGTVPAGPAVAPSRPAAATVISPAPSAPAAVPPVPRTHRVNSGDTLSRISNRYYGTATRWQEIYNANRDRLRNPDVLPLDVELRIP